MAELPPGGIVTAVEPQKHRKNRLSVFIEGEFAFGIDQEIAAKYGIQANKKLEQEQIRQILQEEEYKKALERSYRFLAARSRSEQELRRRLQEYRYPEILIEKVIDRCRELGYIDDRKFAIDYARNRLNTRPVGRQLLYAELQRRGVNAAYIEEALAAAYTEYDEVELARKLAHNRWHTQKNKSSKERIRQRVAQFLRSRGFEWDIIQNVIEELATHSD